ncbi:expressed unknown protein [Seminavis robusta]|uniref:Uncharacterized protein n=1 Tax=Seminavis robusta TaxID=568900 RepID=A0A9N8DM68_9STRA|nr:expressed unknown protein [Seminavis robusta]|eukprot:Sro237_g095380.1 n/a (136) ;mRNA; f:73464-74084
MVKENGDLEEDDVMVCCALCCINCGLYTEWDCMGISAKIGLLCMHCKCCCKCRTTCLPCYCCGPVCQRSGCALLNLQLHACCVVLTGAFPCNQDVPLLLNILGWNIYPRCGCYETIGYIRGHEDEGYIEGEQMER